MRHHEISYISKTYFSRIDFWFLTFDLKNSSTKVTPIITQSIQFFLCSESNVHVNVFTGSQSFLSQSFCSAEKTSEKADKFSASRHVQLSKVWQYRLWSLQTGDIKLKRVLPKSQHTQRKFLSFENCTNGEPH